MLYYLKPGLTVENNNFGKKNIDNVFKSIVFLLIWLQVTAQHIESYYLNVQRLQMNKVKLFLHFISYNLSLDYFAYNKNVAWIIILRLEYMLRELIV